MSKSRAATQHGLIPLEVIERRIYFIRTHKVMLDRDLAELYGVRTKRLNEQVKRNIDRFPADFMFRLNQEESDRLRSQFATSKHGRGGRRYQPCVFTEHWPASDCESVCQAPRTVGDPPGISTKTSRD